jgi:glycosyltransferase involved in cell wall biosynthesis
MPPAPTGIASYSARVLEDLRPLLDRRVLVRWPVADVHEGDIAEHALAVFHIGNNVAYHRDIYRHAIATPGLVVLHDLALDDFVRGLVALGDPLGYRAAREATRVPPPAGDDPALDGPLATPWAAHVARRARGLVVHAPYARDHLRAAGVRTPIHVVPHPVPERPEALAAATARRDALRAPLAAAGMRTLVGVFGDLNEAKLLDRVLAAVATLDRSVHLVLVGRRIPSFDAEALAAGSGLGDRVRVLHDLDDAAFLAWLAASDVVVDLRHPHRGEVSGSLARAMQAGRPTVVSGVGTYLDVPATLVEHVAAGPVDPRELAAAIGRLAEPSVGRAMGEAAAGGGGGGRRRRPGGAGPRLRRRDRGDPGPRRGSRPTRPRPVGRGARRSRRDRGGPRGGRRGPLRGGALGARGCAGRRGPAARLTRVPSPQETRGVADRDRRAHLPAAPPAGRVAPARARRTP